MPRSTYLPLIVFLLAATSWIAGCDSVIPTGEKNITKEALASAQGYDLIVNTADRSEANFHFRPVSVEEGGIFAVELIGGAGGKQSMLVSFQHRGQKGPTKRLEVTVGERKKDRPLTVFCRQGEDVLFRTSTHLGVDSTFTVGKTVNEPTSYHYEEVKNGEGEAIIKVEVDYEENGAGKRGSGTALIEPTFADLSAARCTHVGVSFVRRASVEYPIQGVRFWGQQIEEIKLIR